MSFEIKTISGESRFLRPTDSCLESVVAGSTVESNFVDQSGCAYTGFFDGRNVIFSDGAADHIGQWIQGTPATIIRRTRLLPVGFTFTFMDHGHAPQRLHAVWEFGAPHRDAMEAWKLANFSISSADRYLNRNHPRSSIHLRTKGEFATGADSSHVIISSMQVDKRTTGEIHVGEFNPFTGFGIGFVLHQLEGCSSSKLRIGR
jgi:hypothetical protein